MEWITTWINKTWNVISCEWKNIILKNNPMLWFISYFLYEVYGKQKVKHSTYSNKW